MKVILPEDTVPCRRSVSKAQSGISLHSSTTSSSQRPTFMRFSQPCTDSHSCKPQPICL